MFDPDHFWGPYIRVHGPPVAGGPRQTYMIMEDYTLYVPVLRCWYLVADALLLL